MASLQVLVTGAVLFVLYFYLLRTIGASALGIWSVVLASSSTARLSELGLSGGVVKFVAKHIARDDPNAASDVVQTACVSIAIFMAAIVVVLYPVLSTILQYFLPAESVDAALSLVPFALISFWFASLGGIFNSALDGVLRTDIRSLIMIAGTTVHLVLVFALVPEHGLIGLAYAQVAQSILVLIISWSMLRRYIPTLPRLPHRWSRSRFGEMLKYGLNLQIGSIAQMLCDPATKVLMSKFGNLDLVAYYEMANRMVTQLRALVVSASQVMVPVISGIYESTPERLSKIYRDYYGLLLLVALPLFSGIIAVTPVVSELWIGAYEQSFVTFAIILALGWFSNTFNAPSYFANMGTGHLNWNTFAHVSVGVLNVIFGVTLGMLYGGLGVALGFAFALIIGSALVIISYHVKNQVPFTELMREEHWPLVAMSIFVPICSWYLYSFLTGSWGTLVASIVPLAFVVTVFAIGIWLHPRKGQLMQQVSGK